ncbi:MAG TPA: YfhO family protein [Chthoniobacterales bacterium]|nr:YfhO family protein [Chthoniobacterales bacterium]
MITDAREELSGKQGRQRVETFPQGFPKAERWGAALFFAAVIALAFPQVVFFGRSLVPSNNYNPFEYTFNEANYGPKFIHPEEWSSRGLLFYANFHDPGGDWWQGEPALEFFRRAIFSGQFPFWDPTAAAGAPAYANPTSEFLFPPQILLSLAGSTAGEKNFYILLLFWTAGFATYCFLRLHRLRPISSAAGGLIFLFSGAIQQMGPSIMLGQTVACMPVVLLATRWFLDGPTWRRSGALAGLYAMVSFASFPPILCACFGFAAFYFVCAVIFEKRSQWLRLSLRFATVILLSLGLAAVYYAPVLLTITHTPYVTGWYTDAARDILAPRAIFDLFSPTATGGDLIYSSPILDPDLAHLYYVGAAGLALAGLAFGRVTGSSRTLLVSSAAVSVLVLLKIFGVPPVQWAASLPVLQSIHFHIYFGILIAFLVSLLAALGMERLVFKAAGAVNVAAVAAVLAVGLVGLWLVALHAGGLHRPSAWRWVADYHLIVLFGTVAMVLAFFATLGADSSKIGRAATVMFLSLIFAEGVTNATYPRQKRWDVFAHPPAYVSAVKRLPSPSRLFVAATLTANLGSAVGLETLDSLYMFSPPLVYDVYQKYAEPAAAISMREATLLPPEPVLDRAGIGYVLVRQQLPVIFTPAILRGYPVIYQDDYVRLFRRPNAPRYLFSSDYEVINHAPALERIATAPSDKIILQSNPGFAPSENRPDDPAPQLISAKLNSVDLRISAPRQGLLYVADSFYPGWSASVNGRPGEILPANYGFRAVAIPAGDVHVRFSYLPQGLIAGLIVSLFSLAITVWLAIRNPGAAAFAFDWKQGTLQTTTP